MTFLFGVSPRPWSETPCRANLNSELEPALEIPEHLQEEGEPENEKPPNEKSKISTWEVDHRIMPSSAKPGQGQPEAVRFSQLKKKNFRGFSPLVLTIERPLQIYQQGEDSPKGGVQNLESIFFAYLFLLSHRFCSRRSMLEKKTSKFY